MVGGLAAGAETKLAVFGVCEIGAIFLHFLPSRSVPTIFFPMSTRVSPPFTGPLAGRGDSIPRATAGNHRSIFKSANRPKSTAFAPARALADLR
jgi:hypothetical protein